MYPLDKALEPMKPCKVDKRKPSHVQKLERAMTGEDYFLEYKIDGYGGISIDHRLFSIILGKHTKLPAEKSEHLPHIIRDLQKLPKSIILHGEIYYPGRKCNLVTSIIGGYASTAIFKTEKLVREMPPLTLPTYVQGVTRPQKGYLRYVLYDILRDAEDNWLLDLPYEERRIILEEVFNSYSFDFIDLNRVYTSNFDNILDEIFAQGLEGAVLKSKKGKYIPGKRPAWNQIKVKQEKTDDVVIMGYNDPVRLSTSGNPDTWLYWENGEMVSSHYYHNLIGSLRIGKYDALGELIHIGNVSGMTHAQRVNFTNNKDKYIGRVIKIKAMEDGMHKAYRHGSFVELHPDKNPKECKLIEND